MIVFFKKERKKKDCYVTSVTQGGFSHARDASPGLWLDSISRVSRVVYSFFLLFFGFFLKMQILRVSLTT